MKNRYSAVDAVSGIQGKMDQAVRNQTFNRALGGLAGGIQSSAQNQVNQGQYDKMGGAVDDQMKYFQSLVDGGGKTEQRIGNENLLRLKMLKLGMTPGTMDQFSGNYKNIMGADSAFDPIYAQENAQIRADAYGARNSATDRLNTRLDDLAAGRPGGSGQNEYMDGLFSGGRSVLDFGKNVLGNFGQGSRAGMVEFSGADVDLGS